MLDSHDKRHGRCKIMADECPDDDVLAAFVSRNLRPTERAEVEAHLGRCRECREVVAFVIRCEEPLPDDPYKLSSDH